MLKEFYKKEKSNQIKNFLITECVLYIIIEVIKSFHKLSYSFETNSELHQPIGITIPISFDIIYNFLLSLNQLMLA